MRIRPLFDALVVAPLLAWMAAAQSPAQRMNPRRLGPAVATYGPFTGDVRQAVELADRRVLLNDPRRQLLLVTDSTLRGSRVVLDSAGGKDNSYGEGVAPVYSFRGDSLLFSDLRARTFLVLDTALRVRRTLAGATNALHWPEDGFDRWSPVLGFVYTTQVWGDICNHLLTTEEQCHGYAIVMNPDTRAVDTLARFYSPDIRPTFGATSDHVTVTADGSIAILRSREYRIEWVNPDRSHTMGPRLPYPWVRLDDAGRTRIVDSLMADAMRDYERALEDWVGDSTDVAAGRMLKPRPGMANEAFGGAASGARGSATGGGGSGAGADPSANSHRITATRVTDGAGFYTVRPRLPSRTDPANLPEYIPPVTTANTELLADRDNRLWIHAGAYTEAADGPLTYDIVDRAGALVDRVQLPPGRTIIGFGKGGVVYLVSHDTGQSTVEKARIE